MTTSLFSPFLYSHPVKVFAPYLLPTSVQSTLTSISLLHFFTNLFSDQDVPLYFFVLFISSVTLFMLQVCSSL